MVPGMSGKIWSISDYEWRVNQFLKLIMIFMEFWIQVHGIPHDHMNKETGILIGGMLGVLAEAEDPIVDGILRRSFLRIRIGINITKALSTDFC
ncbi:hypothetical protein Ahy_B03g066279 [Arachis hypogaea]|uniref:DUF4283 domain-containing protein n=1 Tax=Arachis hypogaea TaxID=3818 RepID=A0A445A3M2_ARAHY|nr:hypothetical protein Ahy_B03g066279 [Arachis hypogaea]